jgi:hypothetical protein
MITFLLVLLVLAVISAHRRLDHLVTALETKENENG